MKKLGFKMLLCAFLCLNFVWAESIYPISREVGSGTRSAFVEIFEVQKQVKDKKVDAISQKAEITNSTGVMLTTVANLKGAIGYVSLGSLNDSVKSVHIDGVSASVENIHQKAYQIFRNFNLVTKKSNPVSEDFLNFILSKEAVDTIQKAGYIATADKSFKSANPSGKIVVAGSSSVSPLMEKLKEHYEKINPKATIEVQQSDSTTGVNSVVEGIADIGMVSRELKDNEIQKGLTVKVLAIDGLAVIVHKDNPVHDISKEMVRKIFTGEVLDWDDVSRK